MVEIKPGGLALMLIGMERFRWPHSEGFPRSALKSVVPIQTHHCGS